MTLSSTATFFHALYLYFSCTAQPTLAAKARKQQAEDHREMRGGCTNLEGEGAGLRGLGEVFAGALLIVCVELDVVKISACLCCFHLH